MMHRFIQYAVSGRFSGFKLKKQKFNLPSNLQNIGLYLHIPFCRYSCPYCPYNKCPYEENKTDVYINAIIKEINLYKSKLANTNISSVYIGGGTPTLLLKGIEEVIKQIKINFILDGSVGIEAHPEDINSQSLSFLSNMKVSMLSIGIQSFNDRLLKILGRSYDSKLAQFSIEKALSQEFKCINIDLMWALPTQTLSDLKNDIEKVIKLKVDQISFYPLMIFNYTRMKKDIRNKKISVLTLKKERQMYNLILSLCLEAGYKQTSIWTFTRENIERYSSVTRERYLGLGAGSVSLINQYFYINTFWVDEYIRSINNNEFPIALTTKLSPKEQAAYWLFWRFYDASFNKVEFSNLFQYNVIKSFLPYLKILRILGLIKENGDLISLTNKGLWWFHKLEKEYSYRYLAKIWEKCLKNPWPKTITI